PALVDLRHDDGKQHLTYEDDSRRLAVRLGELDPDLLRLKPGTQAQQIAEHLLASGDRPACRGHVAAAVGPGDHVVGEQLFKSGHIAFESGSEEAFNDLFALCVVDIEAPLRMAESFAGPAVQLPRVRLLDTDGFGDFPVAVPKRVTQYEHRAFGRREPLRLEEQRS